MLCGGWVDKSIDVLSSLFEPVAGLPSSYPELAEPIGLSSFKVSFAAGLTRA